MIDALKDYPVVIRENVRWGDMDAFEHVNNTVYFQYFESVRVKLFERIGFFPHPRDGKVGPIMAGLNCRFCRPLRYPDTIQIGAKVTSVQDDRMETAYVVWSETLNAVAAEGTGLVIAYDYAANARGELPAEVKAAITALAK